MKVPGVKSYKVGRPISKDPRSNTVRGHHPSLFLYKPIGGSTNWVSHKVALHVDTLRRATGCELNGTVAMSRPPIVLAGTGCIINNSSETETTDMWYVFEVYGCHLAELQLKKLSSENTYLTDWQYCQT